MAAKNKHVSPKYLVLIFLFVLIGIRGFTQSDIISGKIIDEKSKETIPFCNVVLKPGFTGTVSNAEGEFVLQVSELPVQIAVSNIAYQTKEFIVSSSNPVTIELVAASTVLEEVVVKEKRYDKYAVNLARRALVKTSKDRNTAKFGRAFYRQKSQNDSSYVELMEIFYDVKYNSNGIIDWEVQEGRYAEDKHNLLNRNFTLLSRLFPIMQPKEADISLALGEEMTSIYDIFLEDIIEADNQRLAIVSFTPSNDGGKPTFSGNLYINIDTFEVMKVVGGFQGYDLSFIRLTDKNGSYENLSLQFETAFRKDSVGGLLLDYIKMDQKFDYHYDGKLKYPVHSESFLSFYDYYQPIDGAKRRLGGKLKFLNDDRRILDLVGYNKKFWEDNPIVKRTPVEEEVINSFEENRAFGTIFLNSFEQIALNETDIKDEPFLQDLLIKTKVYEVSHPVEKVYLHTDKSYYASGESIWYSSYVVDADGLYPTDISNVLRVDLVNPAGMVIISQKVEIQQGRSNGMMVLPKNLPTGKYLLRGYTQWMRNDEREHYFSKEITIYNAEAITKSKSFSKDIEEEVEELDIQFLPEGGDMIEGITSIIGFRAVSKNGKSMEVEGSIVDETGTNAGFFQTVVRGMGKFQFRPEKGKKYFAKISGFQDLVALPKALPEGYVLHIRNSNPKGVKVRLVCSEHLKNQFVYLIATAQGKVYFRQKYAMKNGVINVEVPKNRLPSGILRLTLVNEERRPLAERIVFVNKKEETNFNLSHERIFEDSQDLVSITITTTDDEGKPVASNFSLVVTDQDKMYRTEEEANIISELLLQSDMKSKIENVGMYFNNSDRLTLTGLDLVMMTHGWRKFPWQELLFNPSISNFWSPEKGIGIKGVASNPQTKEALKNHQVALISLSEKSRISHISETNEFGIFSLDNLRFTIHDRMMFKVLDADGRVVPSDVVWEPSKFPYSRFRGGEVDISDALYKEMLEVKSRQRLLDTLKVDVILEEVIIKGKRIRDKLRANQFSQIIDPHSSGRQYTDIFELISVNVPGAYVTGGAINKKVSLGASQGMPLFIVDGMEMNGSTSFANAVAAQALGNNQSTGNPLNIRSIQSADAAFENQNAHDLIGWVSPNHVKRIEVLKRFNAAAYGSNGVNGVIIIHTDSSFDEDPSTIIDQDAVHIQETGYEPVRTFYQPKFDEMYKAKTKLITHQGTIYWMPSGYTDENGKATLTFYAPKNANLQFVVEGISSNGKPGMKLVTENPR